MLITEEKVRQIGLAAQKELGPTADPRMVKKVVREVVRRLIESSDDASGGARKSPVTSY